MAMRSEYNFTLRLCWCLDYHDEQVDLDLGCACIMDDVYLHNTRCVSSKSPEIKTYICRVFILCYRSVCDNIILRGPFQDYCPPSWLLHQWYVYALKVTRMHFTCHMQFHQIDITNTKCRAKPFMYNAIQ